MRGVNYEDSGGLGVGGGVSCQGLLCFVLKASCSSGAAAISEDKQSQTRSASLKTEPWSSFKPAQLKSLLCNGTL